MVAASIAFPQSVSAQRVAAALDEVMTEGIAEIKGKVEHKNLDHARHVAGDRGQFKRPDGYQARLLVVATGTSLILVVVHAKSGPTGCSRRSRTRSSSADPRRASLPRSEPDGSLAQPSRRACNLPPHLSTEGS